MPVFIPERSSVGGGRVIDRPSYSKAADVSFSCTGNSPFPTVTQGSALSRSIGPYGRAIQFNQSIAEYTGVAARGAVIADGSPFAGIVVSRWDTDNGRASATVLATSDNSGGSQEGWSFELEPFQHNRYVRFHTWDSVDNNVAINFTDLSTADDSTWHVYAFRIDSQRVISAWKDGVKSATTSTAVAVTPPHSSYFLGGRKGDASEFRFSGALAFVAILDGYYSDRYMEKASSDPLSVLSPSRGPMLLPEGGASQSPVPIILSMDPFNGGAAL